MSKTILITGASSGFGRLTAESLAKAGHIVYASMRDTTGRNAAQVEKIAAFSREHGVDLRTVELDVQSQESVDAAVAKVIADAGRIDVLIHNAGHMASGPAEASAVATAIVNVVNAPFGKRPFRVHIDPSQDGADVGFTVLDRLRAEMLHRVGLSDLLKPRSLV